MPAFRVTAIRTMRREETYEVEAPDGQRALLIVSVNHQHLTPAVVAELPTEVAAVKAEEKFGGDYEAVRDRLRGHSA